MVTGPDIRDIRDIREDETHGVYTIRGGKLVELATTSKDGLGVTIETLIEEGEFHDAYGRQRRLGIRDRVHRTWIFNPFVQGSTE